MDPLTRRVAWTASAAAAMTGALIALAAAVFATVVGHPPSLAALVALVVGSGVLGACVAIVLVTASAACAVPSAWSPPAPACADAAWAPVGGDERRATPSPRG